MVRDVWRSTFRLAVYAAGLVNASPLECAAHQLDAVLSSYADPAQTQPKNGRDTNNAENEMPGNKLAMNTVEQSLEKKKT